MWVRGLEKRLIGKELQSSSDFSSISLPTDEQFIPAMWAFPPWSTVTQVPAPSACRPPGHKG